MKTHLLVIASLLPALLSAAEPEVLWELSAEKLPVLQLPQGAELL